MCRILVVDRCKKVNANGCLVLTRSGYEEKLECILIFITAVIFMEWYAGNDCVSLKRNIFFWLQVSLLSCYLLESQWFTAEDFELYKYSLVRVDKSLCVFIFILPVFTVFSFSVLPFLWGLTCQAFFVLSRSYCWLVLGSSFGHFNAREVQIVCVKEDSGSYSLGRSVTLFQCFELWLFRT